MNDIARRNARIFGEALLAWGMGYRITYGGHDYGDDFDFGGHPTDYQVHPEDREAFRQAFATKPSS